MEFDLLDFIGPEPRKFCDLFPFPLNNGNGYKLYFQHITWTGDTVGIGIKLTQVPSPTGPKYQLKLVAFSSIDELVKFFPQFNKVVKIFEDVQGVPMQCARLIQPVPTYIPLAAIIEALKNPNVVVSYQNTNTTIIDPINYVPQDPLDNEILFYPSEDETENPPAPKNNIYKLVAGGIALYLLT